MSRSDPPTRPWLRYRPHGPYVVPGPAVIVDVDGTRYEIAEGDDAALCRCGASGSKPFCDGSHRQCRFDDDPTPPPWSRRQG